MQKNYAIHKIDVVESPTIKNAYNIVAKRKNGTILFPLLVDLSMWEVDALLQDIQDKNAELSGKPTESVLKLNFKLLRITKCKQTGMSL